MKRIPIVLWYAHGYVPFMLKLSEKFVNKIVTASSESCRLQSKKIQIVGHGINISQFYRENRKISFLSKQMELLYVGRISPVKKIEVIIEALAMLVKRNPEMNFSLKIVGPIPDEKGQKYKEYLDEKVKNLGIRDLITFTGGVPYKKVAEFYNSSHFLLNPSETGSIDKTLLEGILAGAVPITSTIAYKEGLLGIYPKLFVNENTPDAFCESIEDILKLDKTKIEEIITKCQDWVLNNHSLDNVVLKLMSLFKASI